MQIENINKIKEALSKVYVLKQADIDVFMAKIQSLPDEAFGEVMKIADEAKNNQLAFLRACVVKDKDFMSNFRHFMANNYTNITQTISSGEQSFADKILDQL